MMKLELMGEFFDSRLDDYENHMLECIEGAEIFYPYTANLLAKEPNAKVLDLGCGTGLELDEYFKLNPTANVTGIDLAPGMLSVLRNKHKDKSLTLICGSYFNTDFPRNEYDCAVSVESLHHFTAQEKKSLYTKLFDSIKSNGYFILTDYFAADQEEEVSLRNKYVELKKEQKLPEDKFYHFDTPLTVDNEKEVLLGSGFKNVEIMAKWGATYTLRAYK